MSSLSCFCCACGRECLWPCVDSAPEQQAAWEEEPGAFAPSQPPAQIAPPTPALRAKTAPAPSAPCPLHLASAAAGASSRMTFSAFSLRSGPRSVGGSPEVPAQLSGKEVASPPRAARGSVGRTGHYRGNVRMPQTVQEWVCACVCVVLQPPPDLCSSTPSSRATACARCSPERCAPGGGGDASPLRAPVALGLRAAASLQRGGVQPQETQPWFGAPRLRGP